MSIITGYERTSAAHKLAVQCWREGLDYSDYLHLCGLEAIDKPIVARQFTFLYNACTRASKV